MSNDKKTWTVIGFWLNADPIVAATIQGDVEYWGGDALDDNMYNDLKGGWSEKVEAPDARTAAAQAVERMRATLDADDEYEYDDNDMENPYPRDREDGEGLGLTRPSYGD